MIDQIWGWDEGWQRGDFERRFQQCRVSVIEAGARAAGGLWVETRPDSLYIHELQLAPEFQRRGIGTAVLQDVIAEATACEQPVALSVFTINPRARQLYERVGFEVIGVDGPFVRMRRDRPTVTNDADAVPSGSTIEHPHQHRNAARD